MFCIKRKQRKSKQAVGRRRKSGHAAGCRRKSKHAAGRRLSVTLLGARTGVIFLAALLLLPAAIASAAETEAFKVYSLSVADELLHIESEDLNEDGLKDIMIIHRKGLRPEETRWISIFWQREDGGFATAADQSWEIDTIAVALDIGNVDDDPRKEICYLTPRQVRYYPIDGGEYLTDSRELFTADSLLGVYPSERSIPLIDFVRDWNEDGTDEVAVFRFGGLSIFAPDSSGVFSIENRLSIDIRTGIGRIRAMGEKEQVAGLYASYSFPAMKLMDYDANGQRDLFTTREDRLVVYLHETDGFFTSEPFADVFFDVRTQKEKIEGIAELQTIIYDLDNDGYSDAIVTKQTAKGLSNFRGVINIYRGGPDGYTTEPDQVIISEGTASSVAYIMDVNGDDRLDLILPSVKISISAIIRFLITRSIPITFNIFLLNEDNRFSDRPDFSKEVKFKIDFSGDSDTQAMDLEGDYNGDKRKDFAFGTDEDELSIFLGISGKSDRLFSKKPVAKIEVPAYGQLLSPDLNGDGYSDMIIYYPQSKDKKGTVQVLINLKIL